MSRYTASGTSVLDWTLNPYEIRETIGRRLQAARRRRGISQAAVARAAGITQPSLSNYERGLRHVTVITLLALCGALEIEPAAIIAAADYEGRRTGQGNAA